MVLVGKSRQSRHAAGPSHIFDEADIVRQINFQDLTVKFAKEQECFTALKFHLTQCRLTMLLPNLLMNLLKN